MSARTGRSNPAQEPKRDQLLRLTTLTASAVDLIQSEQRPPEMAEALLTAHQLFKENKLGGVWRKIENTTNEYEYSALPLCEFLNSLKEGEVWKLSEPGYLNCGDHQFRLPQVCYGADELYEPHRYAALVERLLVPVMALFAGLRFQYVR